MVQPAAAWLLLVVLAAGCAAGPRGPEPPPPADVDAALDAGPSVRLAVALGAARVAVEGTSLVVSDAEGGQGALAGRPGAVGVVLAAAGGEVTLDGRPSGAGRLRVEGAGPLVVAVDGGPPRRLRGRVELLADGGALLVVNEIAMERYLAGVVPLEMDARTWPMEALKAQAVASRTYARFRREARRRAGARYDLETSVLDQVYGGVQAEDPRAAAAVAATAGEWLADAAGAPILAAFHSTAGGHTEASEEVWGTPRPYLVAQRCPYDRESPVYEWRVSVPVAEVERRLVEAGYPAAGLARLDVRDRTGSGRARTIVATAAAGSFVLPATDLRRLLGFSRLKSTAFEVARDGQDLGFEGRGAGHGVGMCQWGARGMALAGHDYRQILEYYYPGARLVVP
ncbi:MAG TPA: SpoIID/LytB domain-containing protein [Thermodesulfobacteriota bacterium]